MNNKNTNTPEKNELSDNELTRVSGGSYDCDEAMSHVQCPKCGFPSAVFYQLKLTCPSCGYTEELNTSVKLPN